MTEAEIRAAIAELEAARRARLLGGAVTRTSYEATTVERSLGTLEEIGQEIARLKIELSKLTGEPAGFGPFRPSLGIRP